MSLSTAHRKFCDLPKSAPLLEDLNDPIGNGNGDCQAGSTDPSTVPPQAQTLQGPEKKATQRECLLRYIEENVIGKEKVFSGPYGLRKVEYCDYTASGRSLTFIEDYITKEVLPDYGNTHTTTTVTSLQTTLFRNEARDIVRNAVNASEHDAVIFVGSGCTAAVHKLLHALYLNKPPVVFVGPYEHHSNLLPWRETDAAVFRIRETVEGLVDLSHLEMQLKRWEWCGRQLIGCFSAASNVTGVLTDVNAVTIMLHRHGAFAFWDYATAGAYAQLDMNPVSNNSADQAFVYKDAMFLSPHKFVGGVQTPGVLVAKKSLFKNPVPSHCGGGSVFFVRRAGHRYLQEAEAREEGGTPAIVESVRAGLVFQLKEALGSHVIMDREHYVTKIALEAWSSSPNLVLLGPTSVPRLAIFSFLVRHPATRRFLHHNFVTALLNDLFGIQARGGCACAGPYAQDLLGINEALAIEIEDMLVEDSRLDRVHLRRQREYSDKEILRPGFVRLNLPFFASDDVIQFVVDAVKMVAEHAWKFLPQYTFNPETGEWRHRSHQVFRDRKWLGFISYKTGCMAYRDPPCSENGPLPATHKECLEMAQKAVDQTSKVRVHIADQTVLFADGSNHLRWFLLPSEALSWLQDPARTAVSARVPFEPVRYPKQLGSCVPRDETSVHLDLANVGRSLGKVFSNGVIPRKAASAPALVGKNWAPQRRKVPKGRSRPKLSRCHSEDRAVSAMTASLLADGFFAALKNIGQDTRSDNYAEGLQKVPSRGFAVDTLDANADDVAFDDASSEFSAKNRVTQNGGHAKPRTKGKVQVRIVETEVTNKQLAGKEFMSGDQNPVAGSVRLGESAKEGLECRDGACFKKREHSDDVTDESTDEQHRHKWHPPNRKIFNPTIEALEEFAMIHDGDRVLVCLSGGKDSLSLLHSLHQYQFYAKKKGISFELGAVTVDPMTSAYDPSPLKGYLKALGLPYFYEEQAILEAAEKLGTQVESICSFCSRMKRGRIYLSARREGYNVLAMGQHLDDLAESFLMSVFHNGLLRTMKACYTVQQVLRVKASHSQLFDIHNRVPAEEGDLRVIRPFVYVREKDLREFAELKKLPVISENCPACFEAPKERHRMKQLLAAQEVIFPRLFHSIKSAIKPILSINKTGVNVRTLFSQFQLQQDPDEDESEAV